MKTSKSIFRASVIMIAVLVVSFIFLRNPDEKIEITEQYNHQMLVSSDSLLTGNMEYLKDVRISIDGSIGFDVPVSEIMERERKYGPLQSLKIPKKVKPIRPDRENLPQNPESKDQSIFPPLTKEQIKQLEERETDNPQTLGTSFTGATYSGTNSTLSFPPDNMGDVGPTQYIVAVNGRIATFNKSTGTADGIINTTEDNFFASIMTPIPFTFTSDPRIRYDRSTQKWFVIIIDVPGGTLAANRVLFAVSNSSTITNASVWTFFFFQNDLLPPAGDAGRFADYPTLGIDAHALYIGANIFNTSGNFTNTSGYVIRKNSITGAGPLVGTAFRGLATGSGAGPYTPQGVDNFDSSPSFGYFIGVDNATFGTLMIRRITDPGGTPTISSNISLTVSSTTFPLLVPHLGNTGGNNGRLNANDDRLYNAVLRNGRLWTAHNISVNSSGGTTSATRNAVRWYEIQNLNATPSVVQSGTLFDNTASNPDYFWFPSVNISGQGHAAFGFTHAGNNSRINAGTVGRLSGDVLGTLQSYLLYTSSSTAYNPLGDAGGVIGRRWGDYSYTSVDPNDDMTMWTIHQFCDNSNSYGCRVVKLIAPPPVTPLNCNPNAVNQGLPATDIVITGVSSGGSEFFDPGNGFVNRISASISGGVTVNSITYDSPTQVTINISTVGATLGQKNITVINPDGQSATGNNMLDVPLPVELASFNATVDRRDVHLNWMTVSEMNNSGFNVERKSEESESWNDLGFVNGNGTTNEAKNYSFTDRGLNSGAYSYRLKQVDYNGNFEYFNLSNEVNIGVPDKYDLSQNYPNPFNPTTKINFDLPFDSKVTMKIFDITGREIKTLVNEVHEAGYYTVTFDAGSIASGVYFYRIIAEGNSQQYVMTKKMVVIK
jgi:hypothetical protein